MEHQNYITSINTNQPITTRKFFNHLSKTDRQNIERFFVSVGVLLKHHHLISAYNTIIIVTNIILLTVLFCCLSKYNSRFFSFWIKKDAFMKRQGQIS